MANLDMAQIQTIAQSLPQTAPVVITAGSLIAFIQAAAGTPIPFYQPQDGGPAATDLTGIPGV